MKVHFIAVGGSVMHNLALTLREKGYNVSGSDDEIFDPAMTRLKEKGILPGEYGWFPKKITADIDAIILGMHAKADNPELLKAKELGLNIYSFPAYVYEQIKDKTRVVIGGSHGKTTITAMIMHVLKALEKEFDYLVGSQLEGFDLMVKLTKEAPIAIVEGDEYLSSALERVPKFHQYKPHIALLTGIAWDHINVFPTFENYIEQFSIFVDTIEDGGSLVYYQGDQHLQAIANEARSSIQLMPYDSPDYDVTNNQTILHTSEGDITLQIFGQHNLQNMEGARMVCNQLGIDDSDFLSAIKSFSGAAKRMELVKAGDKSALYKDFAHSPSKLKATTQAVKEQYPSRKLVACMELHTYSSLNKDFLQEYAGSMDTADLPIVYYNQHTLDLKRLPTISSDEVKNAFNNGQVKVFTESDQLFSFLEAQEWSDSNLLMMSSGNFDGVDWEALASRVTST